eukprot:scaffold240399_cov46-Attheya_sp.AAC.1
MGQSKYSEVPTNETSDVHFDGVLVQEVTPQTNTMNRDGNDDCSEEDSVRSQRRGAGVLCGVLGYLIGGPILAAVAAVGGAHATKKDGCIGDSARACGDVALTVKDNAKKIDETHDIKTMAKSTSKELYTRTKAASKEFCRTSH